MPFTALAILISTTYTFTVLFWFNKQALIATTIEPSILLDVEVVAQTGALNAQDEFYISLLEL